MKQEYAKSKFANIKQKMRTNNLNSKKLIKKFRNFKKESPAPNPRMKIINLILV